MSFVEIESKASKDEGKKRKKAKLAPEALLLQGEAKMKKSKALGLTR